MYAQLWHGPAILTVAGYKITWKENTEERFTLLKLSYKRIVGFEPATTAWKAAMLPLHHIRIKIVTYASY